MSRLLRANYARMFRSRGVRIALLLLFLLGTYFGLTGAQIWDGETSADNSIRNFLLSPLLGLAVLTTQFIGTDYSDGVIRNKVAVGNGRGSIYLSNLIVCLTVGLLMWLVFLVPNLGLKILGMGNFDVEPRNLFVLFSCTMGMLLAFNAVFVFIAMLCHRKARAAVLCILLVLTLIFAGSQISSPLDKPEFFYDYVNVADGTWVKTNPTKNPDYIDGTKRAALEHLNDALPGGQFWHILENEVERPVRMLLWDGGIVLCTTLWGMWFFKRKNLR